MCIVTSAGWSQNLLSMSNVVVKQVIYKCSTRKCIGFWCQQWGKMRSFDGDSNDSSQIILNSLNKRQVITFNKLLNNLDNRIVWLQSASFPTILDAKTLVRGTICSKNCKLIFFLSLLYFVVITFTFYHIHVGDTLQILIDVRSNGHSEDVL